MHWRVWLLAAAAAAAAAEPATAQPFERPAQERPELPAFEAPPGKRPEIELPDLPAPEPDAAGGPRILVRAFEIEGSTVFDDEELRPLLTPWIGREVDSEDLLAIRDAITELYVEHGYVNSGAVIPDQDPTDGVIRIRVVEGRISAIEIEGARYYRASRLESRVALGAGTPIDVTKLEEALQILQQDPRIERVHARLRPGEAPGDAVLEVRVEEARPWRLDLEADNYANPAFGGYQGEAHFGDENLLGFGDAIGGRFRVADGILYVSGGYDFPLSARGTLLRVGGEERLRKSFRFDEDVACFVRALRPSRGRDRHASLLHDAKLGVIIHDQPSFHARARRHDQAPVLDRSNPGKPGRAEMGDDLVRDPARDFQSSPVLGRRLTDQDRGQQRHHHQSHERDR